MPRELINVHVGQCGNQVGRAFWDTVIREHVQHSAAGVFDESMSSFFRNVESEAEGAAAVEPHRFGADGTPFSRLASLRARAVLVDTEPGVLERTRRAQLGELFEASQVVTSAQGAGAGNNWAQGFYEYGRSLLGDDIEEALRRQLELCDSPQAFLVTHSVGGGTGSGLGSFTLEMMADAFPSLYRLDVPVLPNGDVVTGPYNSVLSLDKIVEHADCVFPVQNKALQRLAGEEAAAAGDGARKATDDGFGKMNRVLANVLSGITCSMRFPGDLNVDLNELSTNLIPFRGMPFISCSLAPPRPPRRQQVVNPRAVLRAAVNSENFIVDGHQDKQTTLAFGVILRGTGEVAEVQSQIGELRRHVRLPAWNADGFKVGLCAAGPLEGSVSAVALSNSCAITSPLRELTASFQANFRMQTYVHHYTRFGADVESIRQAGERLDEVCGAYEDRDSSVVGAALGGAAAGGGGSSGGRGVRAGAGHGGSPARPAGPQPTRQAPTGGEVESIMRDLLARGPLD